MASVARSATVLSAILSVFVAASAAAIDAETANARQAGEDYAQGQLASATKVLQAGVREYPDSAQLYFMLGNALMRSHSWRAAIPAYQRSAKLRPYYSDTYLNLGYACYHDRKTQQAIEAPLRIRVPTTHLYTQLWASGFSRRATVAMR